MLFFTEALAALAGLRSLGELTNLVLKAKVDVAVTEKAIESQSMIISVQNSILTLQAQYQDLLDEKQRLEKRLVDIEDWNTEAAKYTLTEMVQGVFVYALKDDYKTTAPAHWLCPNCYDTKQKSILQFERRPVYNTFKCPQCALVLLDHSNSASPR